MPRITHHGDPYPLGATWNETATNFAIYAGSADRVELCLFDGWVGTAETERVEIAERTAGVWHICVTGIQPGQIYGYRVHGPHEPAQGLRHNPHKLLIDPYARAVSGAIDWSPALYGYPVAGDEYRDLVMETSNSAPYVPKGIVVAPDFDWGNDQAPRIPWSDTVIYEAHVRGLTKLCPHVPEALRGTYAGLAHPSVIEYLRGIGVTAVELLPVHAFVQDEHLVRRGLGNYWGYNTLGFFAPEGRYSAAGSRGGQVAEFKRMVQALHAAGLEVLLDVVYNHTAEGNHLGPTLAFRGLDNGAYYRLLNENQRYYTDSTGCGHAMDLTHPRTLQLVMDSLRYWVEEMHVDGYRFDLATTLGRNDERFDQRSAFLQAVAQDPVLARVKLIAEPWDLGNGGYQAGNFPPPWSEWNDKYRDSVRRFWRGDPNQLAELGSRLAGSSDLYAHNERRPHASINFVAAHDGFTLRDVVSYDGKHNEANGEHNRDGSDNNLSWNCGTEGETRDPAIRELRLRQMRNFLTTLFVSQGVPMLLSGDEAARTQRGNNNAYCQDNEISWHPWKLTSAQDGMLAWTRRMAALRRAHPILRRREYFRDLPPREGERDILWLRADGEEMTGDEWQNQRTRSLGVWLSGTPKDLTDEQGRPVRDDTMFIMMNSNDGSVRFHPPSIPDGGVWALVLDTYRPEERMNPEVYLDGEIYELHGRSMAMLKHVVKGGNEEGRDQ
ncbi:MAG: glycogen debranching protein GlgX [Chloroflexia bacterium]|nr:glycogen debranching protein GlgX [Chloroflexia bacterium]